jgi:hypothetical protein
LLSSIQADWALFLQSSRSTLDGPDAMLDP